MFHRFSATLDDLIKGRWDPSCEPNPGDSHGQRRTNTTAGSPDESSINNNPDTGSVLGSFITQSDALRSETGSVHSSLEEEIQPVDATESIEPIIKTARFAPSGSFPCTQSKCLLDVDEVVAILAQLFDAVAELERLGVAHRDIKPNNILLRPRSLLSTNQRSNVLGARTKQDVSATCADRIWLDGTFHH